MRAGWVIVSAFAAIGLIAAGCGGGSSSDSRSSRRSQRTKRSRYSEAAPAQTSRRAEPEEDVTDGGRYAKREYRGSGQEGLGGEVSQADYKELASVGKDYLKAKKLYDEYMNKKNEGTIDKGVLSRAVPLYNQLLDRLGPLQDKYPESQAVNEYSLNITYERKVLLDEQ